MTAGVSVDPALVRAWLAGRSIARGLPAPVDDSGGWRVDTGAEDERRRYLFATPGAGLRRLGETIDEPCVALKLCAPGEALLELLPPRWRLAHDNRMMVWDEVSYAAPSLPAGHRLALSGGAVREATIRDADGEVAATGFGVGHDGVFVYDRIRTEEPHRRRGLGRALILALAAAAPAGARHVLTATPEGRALYLAMGWRDYCPYATATIPAG